MSRRQIIHVHYPDLRLQVYLSSHNQKQRKLKTFVYSFDRSDKNHERDGQGMHGTDYSALSAATRCKKWTSMGYKQNLLTVSQVTENAQNTILTTVFSHLETQWQ